MDDERCAVYYADTDSLILNEFASKFIVDCNLALIHPTEIGALKNEYPLNNDS